MFVVTIWRRLDALKDASCCNIDELALLSPVSIETTLRAQTVSHHHRFVLLVVCIFIVTNIIIASVRSWSCSWPPTQYERLRRRIVEQESVKKTFLCFL